MRKLPWAENCTAEELISGLKSDARHLLKEVYMAGKNAGDPKPDDHLMVVRGT